MSEKLKRREVLKTGVAAFVLSTAGLTSAAQAKKENKTLQTSGYYRFKLGDLLVTVISDGSLPLPVSSFGGNVPKAQVHSFLKASYSDTTQYTAHTNACIIDTGKKIILIDAGSGDKFQQSSGKLEQNLGAAGYKTKDVDAVILTHAHPDHAWGLLKPDGKPTFSKAVYYVNSVEWDFWTQEKIESKVPEALKSVALTTKNTLIPLAAKTNRIKAGQEILPGITSIDTSGHTIGHISLAITSKKETLIISGDAVHHPYVSFEHPEWHFSFDMAPDKAAVSRKALLEQASTQESLFLGFHLPFPGLGRVARNNKIFRWVPEIWKWEI